MSVAMWASLVAAYPFVVALFIVWIHGASTASTPQPPALTGTAIKAKKALADAGPRRSTMKVEAFGREVARFEILEHVAPDGEVLEFHVPPSETAADWTVDGVADLIAEFDALPEVAS